MVYKQGRGRNKRKINGVFDPKKERQKKKVLYSIIAKGVEEIAVTKEIDSTTPRGWQRQTFWIA